jgi:hypothetical protein
VRDAYFISDLAYDAHVVAFARQLAADERLSLVHRDRDILKRRDCCRRQHDSKFHEFLLNYFAHVVSAKTKRHGRQSCRADSPPEGSSA